MTQVWLLKAINPADFDEPEYFGAGVSEGAVEAWFEKCLDVEWQRMLNEDREFYDNFEDYQNAWNVSTWPFTLAE